MQVGWFHLLADIGAVAASANLFVNYLAAFLPWGLNTWDRDSMMAILIAIPAVANYVGVRSGANLSNLMTVAKISPLALLILFGVAHFTQHPQMIHASEIVGPGLSTWLRAMVFLLFTFAGWESALIPSGEIREPRHTVPFGLGAGLLACSLIYALLQFIVVATVRVNASDSPLADTASSLLGGSGVAFVSIAVMISTYGWVSGTLLHAPRLFYSMAAQGDFPAGFASLHARFHTPAAAILFCALTGWALAISGTFLWVMALSAGSSMFGPGLSILGVAISLALMTGLKGSEVFLMCLTALIATANWLWTKRRHTQSKMHVQG